MLCAKFMQIGEIAWEELEKVGLQHFENCREKTEWPWPIPRNSAPFTERMDIRFFECVTKYMGVTSQNALSLIISSIDYNIFYQA